VLVDDALHLGFRVPFERLIQVIHVRQAVGRIARIGFVQHESVHEVEIGFAESSQTQGVGQRVPGAGGEVGWAEDVVDLEHRGLSSRREPGFDLASANLRAATDRGAVSCPFHGLRYRKGNAPGIGGARSAGEIRRSAETGTHGFSYGRAVSLET